MSAQAQMRALLDQLMGTARDGSVYLCLPTSVCKGVAEKPHVHRAPRLSRLSAAQMRLRTVTQKQRPPRSQKAHMMNTIPHVVHGCLLGQGCLLSQGCLLGTGCLLGPRCVFCPFCRLFPGCFLGHS